MREYLQVNLRVQRQRKDWPEVLFTWAKLFAVSESAHNNFMRLFGLAGDLKK